MGQGIEQLACLRAHEFASYSPTVPPPPCSNRGACVRALVFINPGNPTGQCLTEDNLRDLVKVGGGLNRVGGRMGGVGWVGQCLTRGHPARPGQGGWGQVDGHF